jgi:UV DNA damage endonuclease
MIATINYHTKGIIMELSLCCISNILAEKGTKFRKITYKSFSSLDKEKGLRKISEIAIHNLNVTFETISHCKQIGINGYRMSSDIFPLITHPDLNLKIEQLPDQDLIKKAFFDLSKLISESKIRVSAHPSEYISLTSENEKTLQNSINDLNLHAEIFDRLNLPSNYLSPLNIHIRKDGNDEDLYLRFMNNFKRLSTSVKERLVLENNDNVKGVWSTKKLVEMFYQRHNIPITFDCLHHKFLADNLSEKEAFDLAYETWDCQPLFHYSESKDGTKAHAEMAIEIPNSYGRNIMFDVELKGKDLAILDLIKRIKANN